MNLGRLNYSLSALLLSPVVVAVAVWWTLEIRRVTATNPVVMEQQPHWRDHLYEMAFVDLPPEEDWYRYDHGVWAFQITLRHPWRPTDEETARIMQEVPMYYSWGHLAPLPDRRHRKWNLRIEWYDNCYWTIREDESVFVKEYVRLKRTWKP